MKMMAVRNVTSSPRLHSRLGKPGWQRKGRGERRWMEGARFRGAAQGWGSTAESERAVDPNIWPPLSLDWGQGLGLRFGVVLTKVWSLKRVLGSDQKCPRRQSPHQRVFPGDSQAASP